MQNSGNVVIGGIRTSRMSRQALAGMMAGASSATAADGPPRLAFDLNGQGLAMSVWNGDYRSNLLMADLVHADGQPLVIASRILTGTPIAERSATTDMFHDLAAVAQQSGRSFYLLGGTEEVNRDCARKLQDLYPALRIAGRRDGFFSRAEEPAICAEINASGADIIWVGLGKPNEQAFCVRNRPLLRAGWMITCGGCFNFVAGTYRRAPQWMQDAGLEWIFRMATRPRQLAWRYLTTSPLAFLLLLLRTHECSPTAQRQTHAR